MDDTKVSNAYINNQKPDIVKKQQKRRRRVVKNEIVSIDGITEVAGDNFSNWIRITKQKLIERESKLMVIRVNVLQDIINKQVAHFKIINERMKLYIDTKLYENAVNEQLINNCLQKLTMRLIESWNGIVLNHSKHKFDSFRKYFTTSRSWFDQRKRAILAQYLWIPIFDAVTQFIRIAAKRYFNERCISLQSKFVKSLTVQIVTSIFKQKLKLPSTRAHSLISCSILKECHAFQLYLKTNIDDTINVNKLLQNNPDLTAVTLMGLIIDQLEVISNQTTLNFQSDVYQLFDEFNFVPVYVEPLADYSQNINNFNRNVNKQQGTNTDNKQQEIKIDHGYDCDIYQDDVTQMHHAPNDSPMTTLTATTGYDGQFYRPYRSQSYSVTDQRFSPLRRKTL